MKTNLLFLSLILLAASAAAYDVTFANENYTAPYVIVAKNGILCEAATGDPNSVLAWANADMAMTLNADSHVWGWTAPGYGNGVYLGRLFDQDGENPAYTDTAIAEPFSFLVRDGEMYFYDGSVSSSVINKLTGKEFKVGYAGAKISLSCASGTYSHLYVAAVHINKEKAWDWINGAWSADPNAAELIKEMTYKPYLGEYIITLPFGSGNAAAGGTVKLKFYTTQAGVAEVPLADGCQFEWDKYNGIITEGSLIRLP